MFKEQKPMDKIDFAWSLYHSERDFIKHHENQRTNASSILAAVYAALVVAIGTGVATDWLQVVIALVLTLTGIYGAIFSGKLYELIQLHAARSYEYLSFVNDCFPELVPFRQSPYRPALQ
jgi:fatty acid desaturase